MTKSNTVGAKPKPKGDQDALTPKTSVQAAVDKFAALSTVPDAFKTGRIEAIARQVTYRIGDFDPSRFVMADRDPAFQGEKLLLRDPNRVAKDGHLYIIQGDVAMELLERFPNQQRNVRLYDLFVCTYRETSDLLVYPLMHAIPGSDQSELAYSSKRACIEQAQDDWVQVLRNEDGTRSTIRPEIPDQDPADFTRLYRGMSFDEILWRVFKDHVITDWDHVVIRKIRGA